MKKLKQKLTVYEIRWCPGGWRLHRGPANPFSRVFESCSRTDKRFFVSRCAEYCRGLASAEKPISLWIFDTYGRFLEERTYPRSADPKRSRG